MKKGFILLMCAVIFALPFAAFAVPDSALGQIGNPNDAGINASGEDPITVDTLTNTVLTLINWFSWLIGVAAVVMGLYAGFLFITARDDAKQITTARQVMLYAIIGIAVAIFAFGIIAITKTLIGI